MGLSVNNILNRQAIFESAIDQHLETVHQLKAQQSVLHSIAVAMVGSLRGGGKILFCGNGGSAADSQHLAAEIVGRFRRERRGLPAIALTTDTSILTAVGNDYGYSCVFSRQVEAVAHPGDLLLGLSTSGNSRNVVAALEQAKAMGVVTVAFTGAGGGQMGQIADHLLAISSSDTARIQEAHILAGHMLCDWVELDWVESQRAIEREQSTIKS